MEPNPYAVPQSLLAPTQETEPDRFIAAQAAPLLGTDEPIRFTAVSSRMPSLRARVGFLLALAGSMIVAVHTLTPLFPEIPWVLCGAALSVVCALLNLAVVRSFLVAVTPYRIVLFRVSPRALRSPRVHRGVEEIRWQDVERIEVGGFLSARSLTFVLRGRATRVLHINLEAKIVSGQSAFFDYAQRFAATAPRA